MAGGARSPAASSAEGRPPHCLLCLVTLSNRALTLEVLSASVRDLLAHAITLVEVCARLDLVGRCLAHCAVLLHREAVSLRHLAARPALLRRLSQVIFIDLPWHCSPRSRLSRHPWRRRCCRPLPRSRYPVTPSHGLLVLYLINYYTLAITLTVNSGKLHILLSLVRVQVEQWHAPLRLVLVPR